MLRRAAVYALVLPALVPGCAIPSAEHAVPAHLEAVLPSDVPGSRPGLGVLPFVDARHASSRRSASLPAPC